MILLAAPLALAACDSGQEMESMDEMGTDEMSMEGHDMSAMEESAGTRTASAVGTVTAIDAEAGTLTVDHEPVAELGWPQMVMAFDASEEVRGDVVVGDKVEFTVEATDESNTITALTKQ
ncbi:copper-binding protein [Qipengyuania sp. GH29]|nr:copper-binding protein [Qipengyuania sphaerica]